MSLIESTLDGYALLDLCSKHDHVIELKSFSGDWEEIIHCDDSEIVDGVLYMDHEPHIYITTGHFINLHEYKYPCHKYLTIRYDPDAKYELEEESDDSDSASKPLSSANNDPMSPFKSILDWHQSEQEKTEIRKQERDERHKRIIAYGIYTLEQILGLLGIEYSEIKSRPCNDSADLMCGYEVYTEINGYVFALVTGLDNDDQIKPFVSCFDDNECIDSVIFEIRTKLHSSDTTVLLT